MDDDDAKYKTTRRVLELVRAAEAGERITIAGVRKRFPIQYAAARRYVQLVKEHVALTEGVLGGRLNLKRAPLDEEAFLQTALAELAAQSLAWLRDTSHLQHLRGLVRALRSQLQAHQHDPLDRLVHAIYFKNTPMLPGRERATVIEKLLHAVRERRRCRLEYERLDGATHEYSIEPWFLAVVHGSLFLVGRKMPDELCRTYELSGIRAVAVETATFVPPSHDESSPEQLLEHTIGSYASNFGDVQRVELEVRGQADVRIRRRPLHRTQNSDNVPGPDGWRSVVLTVIVCPELVAAVLGLLPDVRVIAPISLKKAVRDAAAVVSGSDWDLADPSAIPG